MVPINPRGSSALSTLELSQGRSKEGKQHSGAATPHGHSRLAPDQIKLLQDRKCNLSAATLRAKAGVPKADITLKSITVLRRSCAYKALLAEADKYAALAARFSAEDKNRDSVSVHEAEKWFHETNQSLSRLYEGIKDYGKSRAHTRKPALDGILATISDEMNCLHMTAESVRALHPDAPAKPGAGTGHDAKDRKSTAGPVIPEEVPRQCTAGRTGRAARPFTREEAILLERAGVGLAGGRALRAARIPITERMLRDIVPRTGQESSNFFAAGTFNSTHAVTYRRSRPGEEGVQHPIFKRPAQKERGCGHFTGYDQNNPRSVERNLATSDLSQALGFNVIVPTRVGICWVECSDAENAGGTPPKAPGKAQAGLIMQRADGKRAGKYPDGYSYIWENGPVIAEVTKLQLLDHLTGQIDRHAGNYFVEFQSSTDTAVVQGIDNDQCFGTCGDVHQLSVAAHPNHFRGADLPPYVDTEMESATNALAEGKLRKILEDCSLFAEEINAAVQRLGQLKTHIAKLRKMDQVIDPEKWETPRILAAMAKVDTYIGRRLKKMNY